jgi:Tol biopolymer transport system component
MVGAGYPAGARANNTTQASWTRDGQRIVFIGSEADRPLRGFVQSLSGGAPAPVTPEGVQVWPIVSPDSSMILTGDAKREL